MQLKFFSITFANFFLRKWKFDLDNSIENFVKFRQNRQSIFGQILYYLNER
jgi:hypothetical protein